VASILRPYIKLGCEEKAPPLHWPIETFPPSEEIFSKIQKTDTSMEMLENILSL
jgi:hypothetical protein